MAGLCQEAGCRRYIIWRWEPSCRHIPEHPLHAELYWPTLQQQRKTPEAEGGERMYPWEGPRLFEAAHSQKGSMITIGGFVLALKVPRNEFLHEFFQHRAFDWNSSLGSSWEDWVCKQPFQGNHVSSFYSFCYSFTTLDFVCLSFFVW